MNEEKEDLDEFLYSLLRHDLRNKVQIARGYLQLLEDFDLPEEAERYVEKTDNAIKESVSLIERVRTIRSISKEESSAISVDRAIDEVLEELEKRISEEGIEVEKVDGHEQNVVGGTLIQNLFSNLIENSIRHAECEKIRISCEDEGDEIIYTVEDDGKGISEDIKDEIFDPGFKIGPNSGSGLGLFLVKKVAERYGGDVEIKDSDLGGARFDVHLQKA